MELKNRTFPYYQTVFDVQAAPEAGADMIVPDLYPDMARIVDASGQACLKEKILREDRLDLAGLIRVGILYMPEGDPSLKKLDLNIPFNHVFDGHFPSDSEALCTVRLLGVEARAANPRKISVLCRLEIAAQVYAPAELTVPGEVEEACEIRKKTCSTVIPVTVKCKSFTVNEEMELPATRPPVEDILRAVPRFTVTDTKVVGSKVVMKGAVNLGLLYLCAGQPVYVEQEFALSQILDMEGLEDSGSVDLVLIGTGIELDIRQTIGNEARQIGLSLHVEAQCVVWAEKHMDVIVDLYSTQRVLRPVFEPLLLQHLLERGTRRQVVRELLESEDDISQVVDTEILLGMGQRFEDGTLGCEALIKLMLLKESGEYTTQSRRCRIAAGSELPDSARVRPQLVGEVAAAPTSEGVELRFAVDFAVMALEQERLYTVCEITENETEERPVHPSVVLRRCQEGESLWDIAKRYNTTVRDLLDANPLEGEEMMSAGQLLLIPKKR